MCVCMYVLCVRTITFERNDTAVQFDIISPGHVSRSRSQLKVHGHGMNNVLLDCKVKAKLKKTVTAYWAQANYG